MESINLANKKQIEVNLNGKEVIFELCAKNIDYLQTKTKKPLTKILEEIKGNNISMTLQLIYSMASDKKTGKILGERFFKDFDDMSIIQNLSPVIQKLSETELPEAKNENEKK